MKLPVVALPSASAIGSRALAAHAVVRHGRDGQRAQRNEKPSEDDLVGLPPADV